MKTITLKTNEDWLKFRKTGIGASEGAAVLGMSAWRSPIEVYADKISPDIKNYESEKMRIGKMMEPIIAEMFEKETGKKTVEKPLTVIQSDIPYLYCTPDRYIGEYEYLELKNTGFYNCKEDDEVPVEYFIQCQHSMLVAGVDNWNLAVLYNGNQFKHIRIDRDNELHKFMLEEYAKFWDLVQKRIPPEPDNLQGTKKAIEGLYTPTEGVIELSEIGATYAKEYARINEAIKNLEKDKELYSNKLRLLLEENIQAKTDKIKVSWKPETKTYFNSEKFKAEHPDLFNEYSTTTTTRVLRVNIKKEKK